MSDNRVAIFKEGVGALIELLGDNPHPETLASPSVVAAMARFGAGSLDELKEVYENADEAYVDDLILRNSMRGEEAA